MRSATSFSGAASFMPNAAPPPQPSELAQDQAVIDEVLDLLIAPVEQVLHDQQPQDDFDGCRRPPRLQRACSAPSQIGFDLLKQLIVIQQVVEFGQLRLEAQCQGRHQREQVDGRVPVS